MRDYLYKLSIIIPHYNSQESLCFLLSSIGEHKDVEVIVVDDKSTTEWRYLMGDYPYVNFLENRSDKKGPGTARNIGLEHASGEWILFADSDDLLVKGWYNTLSSCFSYTQDIIFFPPDSIDIRTGEENTKRGKWYYLLCNRSVESGDDELLRSKFSSPCSKMIRRSLIEKKQIRFAEIMHCEDSMFCAYTGYYARSVTVNDTPFYCIIDHDGSLTTIDTKEAIHTRVQVLCEQYCFWNEKTGFHNTLQILKSDGYGLLRKSKKHGWKFVLYLAFYMRKSGVPLSIARVFQILVS